MNVEVVFALADRQEIILVTVEPGTTVESAIRLSAIAEKFPGQNISECQTGIWGRPVDREHVLRDGDRVELYRPLQMDPREARRELAASGASMGQHRVDPKDPD